MESLALFFKSAAIASLIFLIIGLVEPWWMLWWEATQNRLKVIKYYGVIAIGCYAIGQLLTLVS